jgi:hypothetical protein
MFVLIPPQRPLLLKQRLLLLMKQRPLLLLLKQRPLFLLLKQRPLVVSSLQVLEAHRKALSVIFHSPTRE